MNVELRTTGAVSPATAGRGEQAVRSARWAIGGLLLVAAILRVKLVLGGGQFFLPDETRYQVSRDAVTMMMAGKVGAGLALPFSNSEHVGFKVLGLIPAWVENAFGRNDHVPAMFFSGFSVLTIALIWLVARRLGASPAGQVWATLLGVCSSSLLFYTRHLFPYDASLALGLTGLYVGLNDGGWRRSAVVGMLAGLSFVTYLGYWALAGTVLMFQVLRRAQRPRWWWRALAAGAGCIAVIVVVLLLIRWATGNALADALRFATTVNQGDFKEGYRLTWEYLLATEGVLFWVWLAAAVYAAGRWWRRRRQEGPNCGPSLLLCLVALGILYAAQVVASNLLEKFVVYGRVARLLVPFFCVLTGLVLAFAGDGRRWRRPFLAGLALLIGVSTVLRFRQPLTQIFPREFRIRGDALLRQRPPAEANSYYRYVNVTHYVDAPELLKHDPAETLLAAAHPYQYVPYLYEGFSAKERRLRLSVDQRMRLVRMVVPPNERVTGKPHGMITLRLRFPAGRTGFTEPLLSIGPQRNGDLFFVHYEFNGRAQFGFESMGEQVFTTEPVNISPGVEHVLQLFSGTLAPPMDEASAGDTQGVRPDSYRNMVYLRLDGRVLLNTFVPSHQAKPDEVYVGLNFVEADSADEQFWGDVISAVRDGLPPGPSPGPSVSRSEYGARELILIPPAAGGGGPEPLVVAGTTGRGVLGFIHYLPGGTFQLGIEIWSVGAWSSETLHLKPGAAVKISFSFGSLFPPLGNPGWGSVPQARQNQLKRQLRITVDGVEVLSAVHQTPDFPELPLYIGVNPIGGSYVGTRFSGKILSAVRVPFENAVPPSGP